MASQLKAPATFPNTSGLTLGPNTETVQPGALRQAVNAAIRRAGIIEHRRSLGHITPVGLTGYAPSGASLMFAYKSLLHYISPANIIYYLPTPGYLRKATTAIGASSPAFDGGVAQGLKLPATAEMNGSVFLPRPFAAASQTFAWWKMDTLGAAPYQAGISQCPDPTITPISPTFTIGAGWLDIGATVAYRAVWSRIDANGYLVTGPPSGRVVVTNTTGALAVTAFSIPVPFTLSANTYFAQLYRTAQNKSGGDPGDEMQLVYQAYSTGALVSGNDIFAETMNKGPALYTNQNQEGADRANYPPPESQHIAGFKQTMFYANTIGKHFLEEQLLAVPKEFAIASIGHSGNTNNFVIAGLDLSPIGVGYVWSVTGCTNPVNNGTYQVTAFSFGGADSTVSVTNAAGVAQAGAAGTAIADNVTNGTSKYHATYDGGTIGGTIKSFTVPTTGTTATRIASTAQSLCKAIQGNASETIWAANYIAGLDDAPGRIRFEHLNFGTAFTVLANPPTFGTSWAQTLDVARNSIPQTFPARIYYSKPSQPEHVPLGNYLDVLGTRSGGNEPILAIVPLRDSLFILKKDGIFRLTGDGTTWAVQRFDDNLRPVCPVDATGKVMATPYGVVNNKLYIVCTNGIAEITDIGTRIISSQVNARLRGYLEGTNATSQFLEPYVCVVTSAKDGCVTFAVTNQAGTNTANTGAPDTISLTYWTPLVSNQGGPLAAYLPQSVGPWTENFVPSSGSAQERVNAAVGLEVGGITYRMPTVSTQPNLTRNIYQELLSDFGSEPLSFGAFAAGAPLPGDRVMVQITNVNAGAGQITITWPTTNQTMSIPAVGMLVEDPVAAGGSLGSLYTVTAISGAGPSYVLTLAQYLAGINGFEFFTNGGSSAMTYVWTSEQNSLTLEYVPYTAGNDRSSKHWDDVGVLLAAESTVTNCVVGLYTEQDKTIFSQTGPGTPIYDIRAVVDSTHARSQRLSVIFTDDSVGQHTFVRGVTYTYSEDLLGRTL